jgi:hypothetical protein
MIFGVRNTGDGERFPDMNIEAGFAIAPSGIPRFALHPEPRGHGNHEASARS